MKGEANSYKDTASPLFLLVDEEKLKVNNNLSHLLI